MKKEYDKENNVERKVFPKVADRVHVFSPNERARNSHPKGATLTSPADKSHLQYQCLDDCFARVTFADIKGIDFPGAYGRQPVTNRPGKIRLYKERAVCLDVMALTRIPRLAYDACTEWTEFICATKTIRKHKPIEDNCILPFYEKTFRQVKKELEKESKKGRPTKSGPTGFAAPEAALLLEKDGP
ncbi:unnamed protein product [Heligmosomoides polygyrus]|uniref:Apple domain-containing protein n=1 Tax=Heligmosomoides polygyrus TaxID=6339 RepID=A0A183G6J6_HELPZ|nr:unnamed protein product [Heligmosomoides polygyrus]